MLKFLPERLFASWLASQSNMPAYIDPYLTHMDQKVEAPISTYFTYFCFISVALLTHSYRKQEFLGFTITSSVPANKELLFYTRIFVFVFLL